jgi:hypothetical protein
MTSGHFSPPPPSPVDLMINLGDAMGRRNASVRKLPRVLLLVMNFSLHKKKKIKSTEATLIAPQDVNRSILRAIIKPRQLAVSLSRCKFVNMQEANSLWLLALRLP